MKNNSNGQIFDTQNGEVVIEAEDTSLKGDWRRVKVEGKESVLWDANQSSYDGVPRGQTLSYVFNTDESGQYNITMNSARLKNTMSNEDLFKGGKPRKDTGNDIYVSVVEQNSGKVIQNPVKLFTYLGNSDGELRSGNTFDADHRKSRARVNLKANTQYRLEVSGRSDGYVLDRITLSNGGKTVSKNPTNNGRETVSRNPTNNGGNTPSAKDKNFFIGSTGAEPIENPDIPANTSDGNDLAKLDFSDRYVDPDGLGTRTFTGTEGANTFQAEALLNAKPEILAEYTNENGAIDWKGITGENSDYHNYWIEGPGNIEIKNFGKGDKFVLRGYATEAILLEESDGVAEIGLVVDVGRDGKRGSASNDLDVLGKATIYHDGSFNFGRDVSDITNNVFDGVS